MAFALAPLLDLLLFKLTWLTLVLGQETFLWLAMLLMLLAVGFNRNWQALWPVCLLISVAGMLMDQGLVWLGAYQFAQPTIPYWLVLLWLSFAGVMTSGCKFVQHWSWPWQALTGASAGIIAYGIAMRLGAVSYGLPLLQTMLLQGLSWGLYLPFACYALTHPPGKQATLRLGAIGLLLVLPARDLPAAPREDLSLLGKGTFKVLWWPLYEAALYSASPRFEFPDTRPFMLSLSYRRDIPKALLIKETLKQWQAQGVVIAPHWEQTLQKLMPDIQQGDTLAIEVSQDWHARLLHNQQAVGELDEPALISAFTGIWLAQTTTHPEFRAQLLGISP